MRKIGILVVCFILFTVSICSADWLSSDPKDLALIANEAWMFSYNLNGINKTDIVGFNWKIEKNNKGEVFSLAIDLTWEGIVMYGDYPISDGQGYICTLTDTSLSFDKVKLYLFSIYGNVASGNFIYYDSSSISETKISSMTGYKLFDIDSNQTDVALIQEDQNQQINESGDSGGGGGGGCFIQSLSHFF